MKNQKFKEIEVNDPVKVRVLNKYWVRGIVIELDENNMATVRVPVYYGSDAFIVKDEKENLQPILLKKEKL